MVAVLGFVIFEEFVCLSSISSQHYRHMLETVPHLKCNKIHIDDYM